MEPGCGTFVRLSSFRHVGFPGIWQHTNLVQVRRPLPGRSTPVAPIRNHVQQEASKLCIRLHQLSSLSLIRFPKRFRRADHGGGFADFCEEFNLFFRLIKLGVPDKPIQIFAHGCVWWHAAQRSPQTQRAEEFPRLFWLLRFLKLFAVFAERLNRQTSGQSKFKKRVTTHLLIYFQSVNLFSLPSLIERACGEGLTANVHENPSDFFPIAWKKVRDAAS